MMTQPIQMFENLTSETSPAGGNDIAKTSLTFEERRMLELRARYARAEMVANGLGRRPAVARPPVQPARRRRSRPTSSCAPPRASSSA